MATCGKCGFNNVSSSAAFCSQCGVGMVAVGPSPLTTQPPALPPQMAPPPLPPSAQAPPVLPAMPPPDPGAVDRAHRRAIWLVRVLLAFITLGILDMLPLVPDPLGGWMSSLKRLTGIVAFALWLRWSSAAYAALLFIGDRIRTYGGAILCWFIPVFNLFRPYQVTADLWKRSGGGNGQQIVLAGWWGACIVWATLWFFGRDLAAASPDRVASLIEALRGLLPVIAAAFGYLVVVAVDRLQNPAPAEKLPSAKILGWLTPVGIASASGVFLVASFSGVFALLSPSPASSLETLGAAYTAKDLGTFNQYLDMESVLYTTIYQMLNSPDMRDHDDSELPSDNHSDLTVIMLNRAWAVAGPFAARNMASLMVTGDPKSWILKYAETCRNDKSAMCQVLSVPLPTMDNFRNWGKELGQTFPASYRGVSEVERHGDIADVTLWIVSTLEEKTYDTNMQIKMRRIHNHWQVIAIRNYPPSGNPANRLFLRRGA